MNGNFSNTRKIFSRVPETRTKGCDKMTVFRNISILWSMIHVLILFIMLFRPCFNRKKTIIAVGIVMGILILGNGAVVIISGFEILSKVFVFTCSIPSFLFFYVMSAEKKLKFLFTFCLVDTTCLWIMTVTNLMDYYVGGGQCVLMLISRLIAYPLVEYLVWRFFRSPFLELQDTLEKGWGIFAGMTLLYYVLLTIASQFPTNIVSRPEDLFFCILVLLLMLFNYVTIFSSLYSQLLFQKKQQGERILQEQKNALEAQLDNQQHIRKMKHDMKGHTVTLSGLLAAGKTKEAAEYLKEMEDGMDELMNSNKI